jgi:hypothetical protein
MDIHIDIAGTDAQFGLYAAAGYELTAGGLSLTMSAEQFQQLCDHLRPWIVDEAAPAHPEAAKDAERYRFLRKADAGGVQIYDINNHWISDDKLDAYIDAALASSKSQEQEQELTEDARDAALWRKHQPAIAAANAMLEAARPLVLNALRINDAAKGEDPNA